MSMGRTPEPIPLPLCTGERQRHRLLKDRLFEASRCTFAPSDRREFRLRLVGAVIYVRLPNGRFNVVAGSIKKA